MYGLSCFCHYQSDNKRYVVAGFSQNVDHVDHL